jgi:[acyl-carrier-protein] S-malonyltransferase
MAAVIGLEYEPVMAVIDSIEGIYLGLYNSPVQIVVAGTFDGLQKAEDAFKEAGARRFVRLKVSGPFHTPLLQEASDDLKELLDGYVFSEPQLPVYANVTGKRVATGEDAKRYCIQQIIRPVRWVEEERSLVADGYERYYEVGPGTVLTGLWRYIDKDNPCRPAGTLGEIERL